MALSSALAIGSLAFGTGGAGATGSPTCLGQAPTITSSDATITGTPGDDVILVTGDGPHTIVWTGGSDTICGTGNDTLDYSQASDSVSGRIKAILHGDLQGSDRALPVPSRVLHLGHFETQTNVGKHHRTKKVLVGAHMADKFVGIENIIGTQWNDILIGDPLANKLEGRGGNDMLFGRGGADTLLGGGDIGTVDSCFQPGLVPCADAS